MKKVAYLMTMILALTLVSTSCCKDEDDIVPKTLEELYPEWVDLYGEAPAVTEGIPSITITIVGNGGVFEQHAPQIPSDYMFEFNEIVITGNSFTLKDGGSVVTSGTFTKSGSNILTITTKGVTNTSMTYTIQ